MFDCRRQIRRIYAITALSSLQFAGACWAALLAARGFSLTQIGLAETVFHLTSFLFEVPSGVVADVFGRRRSMIANQMLFSCPSAKRKIKSTQQRRKVEAVCFAFRESAEFDYLLTTF